MSQLHASLASAGGQVTVAGSLDLSLGSLTPDASGHLPIRPGRL